MALHKAKRCKKAKGLMQTDLVKELFSGKLLPSSTKEKLSTSFNRIDLKYLSWVQGDEIREKRA